MTTFRLHLPSRIADANAPTPTQRGNIVEWDQPLADRLRGVPVNIQVQMETKTILANTLLLFIATMAAAFATIGILIWWVARKGRDSDISGQPAGS
jgi:hypothetical protein